MAEVWKHEFQVMKDGSSAGEYFEAREDRNGIRDARRAAIAKAKELQARDLNTKYTVDLVVTYHTERDEVWPDE